jgi:hypothetical protein
MCRTEKLTLECSASMSHLFVVIGDLSCAVPVRRGASEAARTFRSLCPIRKGAPQFKLAPLIWKYCSIVGIIVWLAERQPPHAVMRNG